MPGFTCNACNAEFEDVEAQKVHYRSEWHRYNLRRKVAGVPGVTEALFEARQKALAEEQKKFEKNKLIYTCTVCDRQYRSDKAYQEHLKSRTHLMNASEHSNAETAGCPVVRECPPRTNGSESVSADGEDSDDSGEWVEAGSEDDDDVDTTVDALKNLSVEDLDWDVCKCFICDFRPDDTIESCVAHMHKNHGFFIPDAEYLKDPKGLLTYLGIKVTKDLICLYCNDRRKPFQSLDAVRKHMISKNHCKLHFGDGDEEEDSDLDDFYDYASSDVNGNEMKIVPADNIEPSFELGLGGAELIIKTRETNKHLTKILGSRQFLKYYRQHPRPMDAGALSQAVVSRYRSMGLTTVQSEKRMVRMKTLKKIQQSSIEVFRTKVGIKNNIIRNLPKNVTF